MTEIQKHGLYADEYLSLCFGEDQDELKDFFNKRRTESTEILKNSLQKYQLSCMIPNLDSQGFFVDLYNTLAQWFGWRRFLSEKFKDLLYYVGIDENDIQKIFGNQNCIIF